MSTEPKNMDEVSKDDIQAYLRFAMLRDIEGWLVGASDQEIDWFCLWLKTRKEHIVKSTPDCAVGNE